MSRFKLSHSLFGTIALLIIEWLVFAFAPSMAFGALFVIAIIGALMQVYVAVEVVEKVRGATHMIVYFCGVVAEFVIFFALQYYFLATLERGAYAGLSTDPVGLVLHSTMVFVFNPIYQPLTPAARALLLINTFGSLALVLFIFQNIAQFRRGNS